MLSIFLFSGILALASMASGRFAPVLRPSTQEDPDDAVLVPHNGITYTRAAPNSKSLHEKRAKDRFRTTEKWANIHSYQSHQTSQRFTTSTLNRLKHKHDVHGHENITSLNTYNTQYGVEVAFNDQKLLLTLDTGSADTWAVSAESNCTTWRGRCAFGPAYTGGFLGDPLEDVHLYVEYGDGEVVQGPLGRVDVEVAGLRVENQTVALANATLWTGNNITSGILGLAYPSLTKAFGGRFGDHQPFYERPYVPVFANMVDQGLVDNFFSIALGRGADDGVIAFGGVPDDLEGVDYDNVAMTDIIIANVADDVNTASDYSFYTIIPDGWLFGTSSDNRKVPYIIDSGTSLVYLPSEIAAAINAAFDPPAEFSFFGGYYTSCDAVPPRVAVVVDGESFWLNPRDLLLREARDPWSGLCMTTVGDGGPAGPFVLGDVFLRNVLAVFDVDDAVMQFAGRRD